MGGILLPYPSITGQVANTVAPNNIPNITLWYNASANQTNVGGILTNNFSTANPTDGTEITAWTDLSGVGQAANVNNSAGGAGPLYKINQQNNLSTLLYQSASKRNLDINPIGAWAKLKAGFTIYTVAKATSYTASFPMVVTDANLGFQWDGTYWKVGAGGGLAQAQSLAGETTKYHIFGMLFDGSLTNANTTIQNNLRLVFRYDKVPQSLTFSSNVGTQTSNTASVMYIGGNNRNTPKTYMDGNIGEVLMWTRVLTALETGQIETYLNNKWNLGL